jgi:hypothetical protein
MQTRNEHENSTPSSTGKMRPARRFLPLCALALLLSVGCATEDGDWAKAQASGTVEAYEAFLGARPTSRYAQQAVDKIWEVTNSSRGSKVGDFETFLARHASSAHAQDAVGAIWLLTVKDNTLGGYEAFAAKHSNDPLAEKAKAAAAKLWAASRPPKPECTLTSDMKVDVSWQPMQQAQSYSLYWSGSNSPQRNRKTSKTTSGTAFTHTARVGEYGARLPMFYRVAAVRNGAESGLSDACVARLLSDHDGTRCQICGQKSVGYCHLREIYVCDNHNTFTSDNGTNWRCP